MASPKQSIWKDLPGQIYLGDGDFVEEMQSKSRKPEDVNIPRLQQRAPAPAVNTIRRRHKNRHDAIRTAYETVANKLPRS